MLFIFYWESSFNTLLILFRYHSFCFCFLGVGPGVGGADTSFTTVFSSWKITSRVVVECAIWAFFLYLSNLAQTMVAQFFSSIYIEIHVFTSLWWLGSLWLWMVWGEWMAGRILLVFLSHFHTSLVTSYPLVPLFYFYLDIFFYYLLHFFV